MHASIPSPFPQFAGPHFEGQLIAPENAKFAVVYARFNEFVVNELVSGALNTLARSGVRADHITTVRVPGAWELSPVLARLAQSGQFSAVIALGAVIRGATTHYDLVAGEAARGAAAAGATSKVPVIFGVLTCDSIEQAIERAGTKAGNKGAEAAATAIEMSQLFFQLSEKGL
jgi:6,7-dimethyl-8-ribityllumazine synthase